MRGGRVPAIDPEPRRVLRHPESPSSADARREATRAAFDLVFRAPYEQGSTVELCVDGARFAVDFHIDQTEHERRMIAGAGPATDTGLLHALWSLPAGIEIPMSALDQHDIVTLLELGDGYVEGMENLTRTFTPAGRVAAVAVVADSLGEAFTRAARLPPIFWRVAAGLERDGRADLVTLGRSRGIGGLVMSSDGPRLLVSPRPPRLGVPAVYRWWLSELAYRNWLYANCAHCTS